MSSVTCRPGGSCSLRRPAACTTLRRPAACTTLRRKCTQLGAVHACRTWHARALQVGILLSRCMRYSEVGVLRLAPAVAASKQTQKWAPDAGSPACTHAAQEHVRPLRTLQPACVAVPVPALLHLPSATASRGMAIRLATPSTRTPHGPHARHEPPGDRQDAQLNRYAPRNVGHLCLLAATPPLLVLHSDEPQFVAAAP